MAEYVEIEQAKTLSGLRIVLPPGRPNPWGEALKGMCYAEKASLHPCPQSAGP